VGPSVGLDGCGKKSVSTGIRSPDRPSCSESLYRLTLNVFNSELLQFNKLMFLVVMMATGECWQVLRSCTVYVSVRFKVRPGLL